MNLLWSVDFASDVCDAKTTVILAFRPRQTTVPTLPHQEAFEKNRSFTHKMSDHFSFFPPACLKSGGQKGGEGPALTELKRGVGKRRPDRS